ncbi:MAG: hypothetical protein NZM08_09590 [Chitinophagales bacterium]|nr:hypothetical protein [Chitinophagales bacterium]
MMNIQQLESSGIQPPGVKMWFWPMLMPKTSDSIEQRLLAAFLQSLQPSVAAVFCATDQAAPQNQFLGDQRRSCRRLQGQIQKGSQRINPGAAGNPSSLDFHLNQVNRRTMSLGL